MRLIDADNLKKDLNAEFIFDNRDRYRVRDLIDIQMTIEAEPVRRGRWINIRGWVHCSVCHSEPPNESNIKSDYCSNCGARMEDEE